ncbi:MAG: hypothetical protein K0Q95_1616 [Bacteroidota bacterium]|jgi:hypothetical protein|nr:hypothetical protein [Bacteroidota bacterium]
MQFLLPLGYLIVFIFMILKLKFFNIASVSRTLLAGLFAIKLIAAAAVWLIYSYHYSGAGDFFTYFSDSSVLINKMFGKGNLNFSGAWHGSFDNSIIPGSKAIIICNAFLHVFSFGNFYVHAVFFVFFSFIGLVALLKAFLKHFPEKRFVLMVAIFFIPDVIFWGSAPLKESILIGLTGLMLYTTDFGLRKDFSKKEILSIVILLIAVAFIGLYVLLALAPFLLMNIFILKMAGRNIVLIYLTGVILFIGVISLAGTINPDYDILQRLSDKRTKAISEAKGGVFLQDDKRFICVAFDQRNSILTPLGDSLFVIKSGSSFISWPLENMSDTTFVTNSDETTVFRMLYYVTPAHSVIQMKKIDPYSLAFLKNIPMAFFSSVIHPTLFEVKSWFHLLAAVENLWIILIILLSIFFFDKAVLAKMEVVLFCLGFSFFVLVIVGLTTPAIGSLLRYRTPGLLFFVTAVVLMIDFNKLKKRIMGPEKTEDSYTT